MLVFLKELFFLSQHNAFYITKCFCLSTRSFVYQHTVFTPQNVPIQSNPSVLWSTVSFSLFSTRMYAFQSCFSKQSYRKAKSIRWSANSCHMATLQSFVSKQSYLKAKSFIWSANSCHMATLQSFFPSKVIKRQTKLTDPPSIDQCSSCLSRQRLQSVIIVLTTLPLRYLLVLQCIHLNVWNCILLRWSADHQCIMPQYLSPNGNLCIQFVHFVHPRPPPHPCYGLTARQWTE